MCGLVTGVQTCALPIWFQESLFLVLPVLHRCRICLRGRRSRTSLQRVEAREAGSWRRSDLRRYRSRALVARPEEHRRSRRRIGLLAQRIALGGSRSEEHTSELQSLMRISYAVFCLKKNKNNIQITIYIS